jgi:ADP-heptose:LPS heptosyltransferase
VGYRWWSPFYNRKVYVHRSRCERHESDYNLDLVRALGADKLKSIPVFPVTASDREYAKRLLKIKGIAPGERIVVVHPGSKGSALNWKPERYAEAVIRFSRWDGVRVLVSGGPGEEKTVQRLLSALPAGIRPPQTLVDECSLRQLASVLKACHCVLSGSTGVMHLAAAVGTPTVSLFGGGPTTSPVRWGPIGNRSLVLRPDRLQCPDCQRGSCRRHIPMDWITVDRVVQSVKTMFDARGPRR